MSENQNIEYKSSWQDDYLKWIYGFANAQGGKIIIGANDSGNIIGIANAKSLMEELPNKIRDVLGIMVDVNLYTQKQKKYIEIIVPSYPSPVSYKGRYFYRSGSTKDDKVIFWNPGSLPQNWTVETLRKKHASLPPNTDIANTFFRCGYIDIWGSGTIKLINSCIGSGLPEPVFETDGNGVTLIIRKDIIYLEYLQNTNLNKRQIEALLFIKNKGAITNTEYVTMFKLSDRTALRDLTELVKKGYLTAEGTTKGRKYFLK